MMIRLGSLALGLTGLGALAVACGTQFEACPTDDCAPLESGGSGGSVSSVGGSGAMGGQGVTSGTSMGGVGGVGSTSGGSAGEAGSGGSGTTGAGGSTSGCDGELMPGEDACVVSEEFGVFVSPLGNDETGEGTRESPYKTLGLAVERATEQSKRVYACGSEGAYEERLELGEEQGGLELYGALDCADWSYEEGVQAEVAPESGPGLEVTGLRGLRLEGFGFTSASATEGGSSSIAAFIQGSREVVLDHVRLSAGAGAPGVDGETTELVFPDKSELDGVPGSAEDGGVMEAVTCPGGGGTTRAG